MPFFGISTKSDAEKLADLKAADDAGTAAYLANEAAADAYRREQNRVLRLPESERNQPEVLTHLRELAEARRAAEAAWSKAVKAIVHAKEALGLEV